MSTSKKMMYPTMAEKTWWSLRQKFQQSIPGVITEKYLAEILKMKPESARKNILSPLKQLKIIDGECNTLDRAKKWRDEGQYPGVCIEIKKEIYPDGIPDPVKDPKATRSWFADATGAGANAVYKMVSFYTLICEADPSKAAELKKLDSTKSGKKESVISRVNKPAKTDSPSEKDIQVGSQIGKAGRTKREPSIHINLQIHISADSSSDQIDQIFASMAKHIYSVGGSDNE